MPGIRPDRLRCGAARVALVAVMAGGSGWFSGEAFSQEESSGEGTVRFEEIPPSFFQIQDESGYFWEPAANGALTSGETRYLQSGLNLLVEDEVFAPVSGEMIPPEADTERRVELRLREVRERVEINRDLWFDPARGAVRVVDSVRNTSGETLTLPVSLRTTFPFAWQSLHDGEGAPLSLDPGVEFGEADSAVLIHFNPSEGRHDTFLVCRAGDGAVVPRVSASTNRRELTLRYELVIPAGGTAALMHWIGQVGLRDTRDIAPRVAQFLQPGRLVDPEVDRGLVPAVANFAAGLFPPPQRVPSQLRSLLALNRTLELVGAQRRGTDLLWLDSASQIPGTIGGSDSIVIEDSYTGSQEVPVSEIAAIRGNGGAGSNLRVFLRDGRVLIGRPDGFALSFSPQDSDSEQELDPTRFSLLLFSVNEEDGVAPSGTGGFLQTIDGAVLAVPAGAALEFEGRTPWGAERFSIDELAELRHVERPHPGFRVALEDGSRIPLFLVGDDLEIPVPGADPIEVPIAHLSRFWKAGLQREAAFGEGEPWIDFEELPPGARVEPGFLLAGNTVRQGAFAAEVIRWESGGQVLEVPAERIEAIRRGDSASDPSSSNPSAPFLLILRGGETVSGRPATRLLRVILGGEERLIPVETLYGYRAPQS